MTTRDETIKKIKAALERRSGVKWSVTGGRGTAWGWITIDAPPARRTWRHILPEGMPDRPENYIEQDTHTPGGHTGPQERAALAKLLGLDSVHTQGVSIPASNDYYEEHIARAEGRTPTKVGEPYWD